MCNPIALALGAVAGTTIYQTQQARKSAKEAAAAQAAAQGDPAAERAKAEADAAQAANAQLADANRRRREQQSLLSKGAAPTFTLGDSTADPGAGSLTSPTTANNRSTMAKVTQTLLSRGTPTGPMSYGGGGGRTYSNQAAL